MSHSRPMTCAEFDDAMMDELYGELDAATSDRLAEHATSCASCAAKFSKLKSTRSALGGLVVTPPDDMESRILAAAAAAEAAMAAGPVPMPSNVIALPIAHHARDMAPPPVPGPQPPKQEGGAKIFAFLSKPQLAAAAVVVLVLGAAAFTTMSMSMKRSPMAASEADQAPAAVAASAAPGAANEPSPMATATTIVAAQEAPAPAASAVAAGPALAAAPPPPPAATMAGGALALNDRDEESKALKKAAPPAARPRSAAPTTPPATKTPAPADGKAAHDFDSAKRLADSGRCAEALPTLEALAPTDSRADLLAARCVRNTQGCGPATTRYDAVATRNSGNATGATAQREKQQCQIALDNQGTKSGGAAAPAQHAKPAKPAAEPAPAATTTTIK